MAQSERQTNPKIEAIVSKLKPSQITAEKEKLYEENLHFKLLTNSYKLENNKLIGRIRQQDKELKKNYQVIQEITAHIENPSYKGINIIAKLSQLLRQKHSNFNETEEDKEIVLELEDQLKNVKNQLNQIEMEYEGKIIELNSKNQDTIEILEVEICELKAENENLEENIEKYRKEIKILNDHHAVSFNHLNEKDDAISDLKKNLENSKKEFSELKAEAEELKKKVKAANGLKKKIEKLNDQNKDLIEENKKVASLLDQNKKIASLLEEEKKSAEKQEKKNLEEKNHNFSLFEKEKKEMADIILKKHDEILQITKELQKTNENFENLKKKIVDLENENKGLKEKICSIPQSAVLDYIKAKKSKLGISQSSIPKILPNKQKAFQTITVTTADIKSRFILLKQSEIQDSITHVSLSLQLSRIKKPDLPKLLFGNKFDSSKALSSKKLILLFKDPPFSFQKTDKSLLEKLVQFLTQPSKIDLQEYKTNKNSIQNILFSLNILLPDWKILSTEDEELLDRELSKTLSTRYAELMLACETVDSDRTGVISADQYDEILKTLNIQGNDKLQQYSKLLFYSFDNKLDEVPYKSFIEIFTTNFDKLDNKDFEFIAEFYLEKVAKKMKQESLNTNDVFTKNEKIIDEAEFKAGLGRLGIIVPGSVIKLIMKFFKYKVKDGYLIEIKKLKKVMKKFGFEEKSSDSGSSSNEKKKSDKKNKKNKKNSGSDESKNKKKSQEKTIENDKKTEKSITDSNKKSEGNEINKITENIVPINFNENIEKVPANFTENSEKHSPTKPKNLNKNQPLLQTPENVIIPLQSSEKILDSPILQNPNIKLPNLDPYPPNPIKPTQTDSSTKNSNKPIASAANPEKNLKTIKETKKQKPENESEESYSKTDSEQSYSDAEDDDSDEKYSDSDNTESEYENSSNSSKD